MHAAKFYFKPLFGVLLFCISFFCAPHSIAGKQSIFIGAGPVTGIYYNAGKAICRFVGKRRAHGSSTRCYVKSNSQSIHNLNALRAGELEFGVVRSDWQFHSINGTGVLKGNGRFSDLRSVLSLQAEPVTLLVKESRFANIFRSDADKLDIFWPQGIPRIPIGSSTKSCHPCQKGCANKDCECSVDYCKAAHLLAMESLCDGKVSAAVLSVSHPSAKIDQILSTCDVTLHGFSEQAVDAAVTRFPYLSRATIPGGMYRNLRSDIKTYGAGATLVTSASVPSNVVYELVMAVFKNLEQLRKLHPVFQELSAEKMIRDGLTAPLHPGAVRAYEELGLMR